MVHIGKDGVNASTVQATSEALNTRELLKVRILDAAPGDARETAYAITEQIDGVEIVQVIGRVAVLYRPFPDLPDIRLPA